MEDHEKERVKVSEKITLYRNLLQNSCKYHNLKFVNLNNEDWNSEIEAVKKNLKEDEKILKELLKDE